MTPDELLRLYPRETLRWLRRRMGVSQLAFALDHDLNIREVARWEARATAPPASPRARLAALLAPHVVTPEGEAFARSLGRGETSEG